MVCDKCGRRTTTIYLGEDRLCSACEDKRRKAEWLVASALVWLFMQILTFNEWRAIRKGLMCADCRCLIVGTGVRVGKKSYCQICGRSYGKWQNDQTSHHPP